MEDEAKALPPPDAEVSADRPLLPEPAPLELEARELPLPNAEVPIDRPRLLLEREEAPLLVPRNRVSTKSENLSCRRLSLELAVLVPRSFEDEEKALPPPEVEVEADKPVVPPISVRSPRPASNSEAEDSRVVSPELDVLVFCPFEDDAKEPVPDPPEDSVLADNSPLGEPLPEG